ncbi:aminotransferase [bacterium]|nr:MAG: aminotransferase [bacterium]
MHKKLFIPGPTEVREDVLKKLSTPQIGHRSAEFQQLYSSIVEKLKKVLYTDNTIILSTSSGTGLMELATRNFIEKRALGTICGAFSDRWAKIAKANGKQIDSIEVEWGKHIPTEDIEKELSTGKYDCLLYTHNETSTGVRNPIEELAEVMKKFPDVIWCVDAVSSMGGDLLKLDELGVDFICTSTQKAFALPSGLAIGVLTDKAIQKSEQVPDKGYYFSVKTFMKYSERNQTPTTPAIPHLFALDYQLDRILDEGMENRYERHKQMAEFVRAWARQNFDLFPEPGYESVTLTTIANTRAISVADLNKQLAGRNKTISNGYGNLKEKTFRIAHMGDMTLDDIKELLNDIEEILQL